MLKAVQIKSEIICQLYLISTQISAQGFCLALRADKPKHVYQYFRFEKKVVVIFSITWWRDKDISLLLRFEKKEKENRKELN